MATLKYFDEKSLEFIKRKLAINRSVYEGRLADPSFAAQTPFEVGFKLTNRCDLRCSHCFQWDDKGYHKEFAKCELTKEGDLDIAIIAKVLDETRKTSAAVYLWGGEPLLYTHFDELTDLLVAHNRQVVMCTNGLKLMERTESLIKISENLTLLISVDGLSDEHNKIRGKNTFEKVAKSIDSLLKLKEEGVYKGKISIACVISDNLISTLFDFCQYWNHTNIDVLFINFPWFIPESVANQMDQHFFRYYSQVMTVGKQHPSWHSFDFKIGPHNFDLLHDIVKKIKGTIWNIKIQFHPDLEDDNFEDFLNGSKTPAQHKTMCLGISSRLDIMPNGDVVACKKFPEFRVGNLTQSTMSLTWNGDLFKKFRSCHNNNLMPICSKCEILYSNGA